MNPKTNYIFVDYENVQPSSFNLPDDYPFKVFIFIGANQSKIPIDLVASIQKLGFNAEYVRIEGNGKNALDFHITFYIGKLCEKDPNGYFHIISKDTGFDILIKHLKKEKLLINRYPQVNDIPALKKLGNDKKLTVEEQIKMIVENLIKIGNSKPRKIETLSNKINSIFMKTLKKEELDNLIKLLAHKKFIKITEKKITYKLK